MRELLSEMEARLKFLESEPKSTINQGKISEICNCIIRVQQLILKELKSEIRDSKINKLI
mgnify:CR=1 FL=1